MKRFLTHLLMLCLLALPLAACQPQPAADQGGDKTMEPASEHTDEAATEMGETPDQSSDDGMEEPGDTMDETGDAMDHTDGGEGTAADQDMGKTEKPAGGDGGGR